MADKNNKKYDLSDVFSEADTNEVDFYGDKDYESEGQWGYPSESSDKTVLGKAGQMWREDGHFGSFPIEDYYGDGDEPW